MNMHIVCLCSCQMASYSYIENRTGAEARIDNRALGQFPGFFTILKAAPEEWVVPQGQRCLQVKQPCKQGHQHASHYRSQHVRKELAHRQHLLSENCPAQALAHLPLYSKGACA